MISIILYGISILFSPGPVTLVALSKGLNRQFETSVGYFVSIGTATYILLLFYGYTGEKIIKKEHFIYISVLGCLYMLYLSYKMFRHRVAVKSPEKNQRQIGFKEGLFMQLFNPKASLATLPIATLQYPMNDISGHNIAVVSLIFLALGILSPGLYCFIGQYFSRFITDERWLNRFNKSMAAVLAMVAIVIMLNTA